MQNNDDSTPAAEAERQDENNLRYHSAIYSMLRRSGHTDADIRSWDEETFSHKVNDLSYWFTEMMDADRPLDPDWPLMADIRTLDVRCQPDDDVEPTTYRSTVVATLHGGSRVDLFNSENPDEVRETLGFVGRAVRAARDKFSEVKEAK